MSSLAFFIRQDRHYAITETKSKGVLFYRFLLARYFHLLASVFRQGRHKNFDSVQKQTLFTSSILNRKDRIGF